MNYEIYKNIFQPMHEEDPFQGSSSKTPGEELSMTGMGQDLTWQQTRGHGPGPNMAAG